MTSNEAPVKGRYEVITYFGYSAAEIFNLLFLSVSILYASREFPVMIPCYTVSIKGTRRAFP